MDARRRPSIEKSEKETDRHPSHFGKRLANSGQAWRYELGLASVVKAHDR
jgi:hypothetical protein